MKNLLMIALAVFTLQATAQENKKEARKGEMKERMEARQDMSPEDMAKLQTKKMTLHLDLTEKQQVEVEKILLAEAKDRKAKMEEFKEKKEKAEGEKPSKEDRLKMMNEKLDHQIEMKKKMKAILNDEQYKKWDAMQEKKQFHKSEMNVKEMHKEK
ncbi:MAG: hypothetical protein KDD03_10355 [Gelidibacter sp.]|nr:hypothetical protein [Gelidibacter sp.]